MKIDEATDNRQHCTSNNGIKNRLYQNMNRQCSSIKHSTIINDMCQCIAVFTVEGFTLFRQWFHSDPFIHCMSNEINGKSFVVIFLASFLFILIMTWGFKRINLHLWIDRNLSLFFVFSIMSSFFFSLIVHHLTAYTKKLHRMFRSIRTQKCKEFQVWAQKIGNVRTFQRNQEKKLRVWFVMVNKWAFHTSSSCFERKWIQKKNSVKWLSYRKTKSMS